MCNDAFQATSLLRARMLYERLMVQFPTSGRYWRLYIEHEVNTLWSCFSYISVACINCWCVSTINNSPTLDSIYRVCRSALCYFNHWQYLILCNTVRGCTHLCVPYLWYCRSPCVITIFFSAQCASIFCKKEVNIICGRHVQWSLLYGKT